MLTSVVDNINNTVTVLYINSKFTLYNGIVLIRHYGLQYKQFNIISRTVFANYQNFQQNKVRFLLAIIKIL